MSYVATFDQQSNKADFKFQISATDVDTGDQINFTGAAVSCSIKDKNDCSLVTISIDGGGIALVDPYTLEFLFTKAQVGNYCGHYKIGCVFELNDETDQLFIGTVSFYDGVASL